jgi:hypothetical protein
MFLDFSGYNGEYLRIVERKPIARADFNSEPILIDPTVETDQDFVNTDAFSSCYINEITNFVFGGINSRFWMLRKHINSLP